eukprot:5051871-Prorocentrum_lima.AAC.1
MCIRDSIRPDGVPALLPGLTPAFSLQVHSFNLLTSLDVIICATMRAQKVRNPSRVRLTSVVKASATCWASCELAPTTFGLK